MSNLMVAKTERLRMTDADKIKKHEGEIEGYKVRLIECNLRSKNALNIIQAKELRIEALSAEIDSTKRKLQEKDTHELVTANSWFVGAEWKFFSTQCDIKSKWKISNARKWTNGKCEWIDLQETENTFKGKVKGKFMCGLHAFWKLKNAQNIKKI